MSESPREIGIAKLQRQATSGTDSLTTILEPDEARAVLEDREQLLSYLFSSRPLELTLLERAEHAEEQLTESCKILKELVSAVLSDEHGWEDDIKGAKAKAYIKARDFISLGEADEKTRRR